MTGSESLQETFWSYLDSATQDHDRLSYVPSDLKSYFERRFQASERLAEPIRADYLLLRYEAPHHPFERKFVWLKFWCVLAEASLSLYALEAPDIRQDSAVKRDKPRILRLKDIVAAEPAPELAEHSFQLIVRRSGDRKMFKYVFQASSDISMREWIFSIEVATVFQTLLSTLSLPIQRR